MKIKGFTLVESMVAMLLIALSFGIWLMIFSIVENGEAENQAYLFHLVDREFSIIIQEKKYSDKTYTLEPIRYARKVDFLNKKQNLIQVELIAFLHGRKIAERKKMIYAP